MSKTLSPILTLFLSNQPRLTSSAYKALQSDDTGVTLSGCSSFIFSMIPSSFIKAILMEQIPWMLQRAGLLIMKTFGVSGLNKNYY